MEILLVLAGSLVGVLSGFFGIGGGMILTSNFTINWDRY